MTDEMAFLILAMAACTATFCFVKIGHGVGRRSHFTTGLVAAIVTCVAFLRHPEYPVELLGNVLAVGALALGAWVGKQLAESP